VHHSLLCSHSVCQGAVGIQAKPKKFSTQHLNHCLSYILCCIFFSLSATLAKEKTKQNTVVTMGSEFKAIILSTWRIPCTLPGKLCPFFFSCVCFCPCCFNAGGP